MARCIFIFILFMVYHKDWRWCGLGKFYWLFNTFTIETFLIEILSQRIYSWISTWILKYVTSDTLFEWKKGRWVPLCVALVSICLPRWSLMVFILIRMIYGHSGFCCMRCCTVRVYISLLVLRNWRLKWWILERSTLFEKTLIAE